MAASLTSTGILAETQAEIFEDLGAAVQASTGRADLNVSTRSAFGRLYSPVAERFADTEALLATLPYAFDPNSAAGILLDVTAFLRGTRRLAASNSTFTVRLIGTATTDVSGRLVRESGNLWTVPDGTIIGASGFVEVDVVADETGPITATVAGPWSIVTPLGALWTGVVGVAQSSVGEDEETDPELRARLAASLSQAYGTASAVYTALAQVPGVDQTTLVVDENRSDAFDTLKDMPAWSIEALVQGGTDAQVAETIRRFQSDISRSYGNTTVSVTLPEDGRTRDVSFTRPTARRVYLSVEIDTGGATSSIPSDAEDTIRAAVVAWGALSKPRMRLTAGSAEAYLNPYLPSTSFSDISVLLSLTGTGGYANYVDPGPRAYGTISDDPSAAFVLGTVAEPFTIGAGWQLDLSINGGPTQSTVFPAIGPGGTAAAVVAAIGSLTGATASDLDGALLIETDLTGASTSIQILGSSTAALLTALGLVAVTYSGRDSDISYTVI